MNFFYNYFTNLEFAIVSIIFALAIFTGVWSGVLSVAPIGFAAIAGYAVTYIDNQFQIMYLPLPLIGTAIGLVLAFLIAPVFLYLSSHYLALATIAFVILSVVLALNLNDITGGVLGIPVRRNVSFLELSLYLAVVVYVFLIARRSSFGLKVEALREQPEIAASLGIDVYRTSRTAWTLGGAIGGLGGALYAQLLGYIEPIVFDMHLAFITLAAVVLGGPYHWIGPVLGAIIYALIPEVLRPILGDSKEIGYGVIVILIVIALPNGIVNPAWIQKFFKKSKSNRKLLVINED